MSDTLLVKKLRAMHASGWNPIGKEAADKIEEFEQKLAASQADNLRLREALIRSIERMCFAEPWSAAESDIEFAKKALATQPSDLSALREVIAQVLDELVKARHMTNYAVNQLRFADRFFNRAMNGDEIADAIRARGNDD